MTNILSKNIRHFLIFVVLIILFIFVYNAEAQVSIFEGQVQDKNSDIREDLGISAVSFLVKDLKTDEILLAYKENRVLSIASLTKLMGAVVVSEKGDLNKTVVLKPEVLRPYGWSPSLFSYAKVKYIDLLRASLIQSSNDAAYALGRIFKPSGVFSNYVYLASMNKKAKELEMNQTNFVDSYGLNPKNKSTAQDLSKLLAYVLNNHPELFNITKENDFWLPDKKGILRKFLNVNIFSKDERFIGGKTGYIPESNHTFVGIFNIKNEPIGVVVLGSKTRKLLQKDVETLLDYIEQNTIN